MIDSIPVHLYDTYFRTGSSVICNPPITNTDEDYMFFSHDYGELCEWLHDNGWELCRGKEYGEVYGVNFTAFRRGKYNALITGDATYYDKFEEATKLATKLNLLEKSQRIALFAYIIEGELD